MVTLTVGLSLVVSFLLPLQLVSAKARRRQLKKQQAEIGLRSDVVFLWDKRNVLAASAALYIIRYKCRLIILYLL